MYFVTATHYLTDCAGILLFVPALEVSSTCTR